MENNIDDILNSLKLINKNPADLCHGKNVKKEPDGDRDEYNIGSVCSLKKNYMKQEICNDN